eukprot:1139699-Pelagomonas_calceolata.AAC.2
MAGHHPGPSTLMDKERFYCHKKGTSKWSAGRGSATRRTRLRHRQLLHSWQPKWKTNMMSAT